jgi:cytochrome c peroxidase
MSVKQYPFFPSTKTKLFLTAVFCLLLTLFFSAYTEKKTPLQLTQSFCLENIKNFQSELDTLQRLAEAGATKQQVTDRFKKSRIAFKRIEFLLEYLDNNRYPFFNGVNAVEMDDGFDPNAKPEGLQVIESELAADSVDYDRVVFLLKQLKYRTLAFYLLVKDAKLRDTYIFEAMRFHLIRLETQNLVSFDSPEIRNNTKEISASLKVLDEIISYYKEESSTAEIVKLKSKITAAIAYLNTKNFTTLDRLFFIKQYLQPMTKYFMAAQQKLNINYLEVSGQLFRAVNLKAATIYDADFINTKFYAQDKYYKNNPLYTALGKKLFFDKRLSADESMSCATCHQPVQIF